MSKNVTDRTASGPFPARFFSQTKRGGGLAVVSSQNVQFETITPNIQTMTPPGTNIGARVRTVSATSIDGSEQSFVDQGFQAVSVTGQTHFETPRMVASKLNEDSQLANLPGNKSLTLEVLITSNSRNV